MADLIQRRESVWKRLTRLFRSGPVVRHKIASGEKFREPQGTARAGTGAGTFSRHRGRHL